MNNTDIDILLKEYKEAREEPDFDGRKPERMAELQKAILEYLFQSPVEGLELNGTIN